MLKIFNDLDVFFQDNYRKVGIREYARLKRMSPPSASTWLRGYASEGLLVMERDRQYVYFFAHRENGVFVMLSRAYLAARLQAVGLVVHLQQTLINPTIIVFGSFAKAEVTGQSDIDIAVFSPTRTTPDLAVFEQRLGRPVQVFLFQDRAAVKNQDLLNNILNGFIVAGGWYDGL